MSIANAGEIISYRLNALNRSLINLVIPQLPCYLPDATTHARRWHEACMQNGDALPRNLKSMEVSENVSKQPVLEN